MHNSLVIYLLPQQLRVPETIAYYCHKQLHHMNNRPYSYLLDPQTLSPTNAAEGKPLLKSLSLKKLSHFQSSIHFPPYICKTF